MRRRRAAGSTGACLHTPNRVADIELLDQAFDPPTLPLTGPGTIAVVISLGLSRASYTSSTDEIVFVLASLAAAVAIAITIFLCFAYAVRGCSALAAPTSPGDCPRLFCSASVSRFFGLAGVSC